MLDATKHFTARCAARRRRATRIAVPTPKLVDCKRSSAGACGGVSAHRKTFYARQCVVRASSFAPRCAPRTSARRARDTYYVSKTLDRTVCCASPTGDAHDVMGPEHLTERSTLQRK